MVATARFLPVKIIQDRDKIRAFAKWTSPLIRFVDPIIGEKVRCRCQPGSPCHSPCLCVNGCVTPHTYILCQWLCHSTLTAIVSMVVSPHTHTFRVTPHTHIRHRCRPVLSGFVKLCRSSSFLIAIIAFLVRLCSPLLHVSGALVMLGSWSTICHMPHHICCTLCLCTALLSKSAL